jgi:hypothetical protein
MHALNNFELFLHALGLSLLIEVPLLFACVRLLFRIGRDRLSPGRILAAGLAATSATLPLVWFVLPSLVSSRSLYEILSESFAVAAEAFILNRILKAGLGRSFLASLLCNAVSFLAGRFLWEPWITG